MQSLAGLDSAASTGIPASGIQNPLATIPAYNIDLPNKAINERSKRVLSFPL
jgi:hypothetical protein